jgi:hypothetical protein
VLAQVLELLAQVLEWICPDISGHVQAVSWYMDMSGYPDIRISGYPDIQISGYPREHGHIWTQYLHAGSKHSTRIMVAGPFHQHTQHNNYSASASACVSLKPVRASSQCWEGFLSWKSSRTARSASDCARTTSSSSTQVHKEHPSTLTPLHAPQTLPAQ